MNLLNEESLVCQEHALPGFNIQPQLCFLVGESATKFSPASTTGTAAMATVGERDTWRDSTLAPTTLEQHEKHTRKSLASQPCSLAHCRHPSFMRHVWRICICHVTHPAPPSCSSCHGFSDPRNIHTPFAHIIASLAIGPRPGGARSAQRCMCVSAFMTKHRT